MANSNIPKDPVMLLSFINMKLRDFYPTLEAFCRENRVDIAVLTLPKEYAVETAKRLCDLGVKALWNFTGKELDRLFPDTVVENVHIADSLMTLCYALHCREEML